MWKKIIVTKKFQKKKISLQDGANSKMWKKNENILDLFQKYNNNNCCCKLNFILYSLEKMNKKETFFSVPFFQLTLTSYHNNLLVGRFCYHYGEVFWRFSKTLAFMVTNFFTEKMSSKDGKGFYYFTVLLPFSITNFFIAEKVSKDRHK